MRFLRNSQYYDEILLNRMNLYLKSSEKIEKMVEIKPLLELLFPVTFQYLHCKRAHQNRSISTICFNQLILKLNNAPQETLPVPDRLKFP